MKHKFSKTIILPIKVLNVKNNGIAFTMAETLVVISVLGVIATLTIPNLYSRHKQTLNRTKIKKAMATYETVVRRMIAENKLANETKFDAFAASDNNCANTTKYFIKTEGEGCKFKTADDIWWDITNMRRPIIAFSRDALDDASANVADYRNSFYLTMSYDNNNIARINDIGYENANNTDNAVFLSNLYDFVNNTDKYSEIAAQKAAIVNNGGNNEEETPKTGVNHPLYQAHVKGELSKCTNRNYNNCYASPPGSKMINTIFDENGNRIGDYYADSYDRYDLYNLGKNYDYLEYVRNEDGSVKQYNLYKDGELKKSYTNVAELISTEGNAAVEPSDEWEWQYQINGYKFNSGDLVYHCYAKGTQITLADGTTKNVEDIKFDDELMVWDFDNGCLASAKPLFIKVPEIAEQYNLLTFSDGRTLKTINQHRIFNKEAGKYTYPMTDDTPIGTTTLLDDGSEVTLVDKKYVYEEVEYYNIITKYHINCFASGISTSCRLNNLYPIKDYKFVKEERTLTPYDEFHDIPKEWYEDLRLAEQSQEINKGKDVVFDKSLNDYVLRLINTNKRQMAIL